MTDEEREIFHYIQDAMRRIIDRPRDLAELKTLIKNMTALKVKAAILAEIDDDVKRMLASRTATEERAAIIERYKEEV